MQIEARAWKGWWCLAVGLLLAAVSVVSVTKGNAVPASVAGFGAGVLLAFSFVHFVADPRRASR
ncbi:MAG: hypothetical protein ACYTG6_05785 [Planctomycetota bacterium]